MDVHIILYVRVYMLRLSKNTTKYRTFIKDIHYWIEYYLFCFGWRSILMIWFVHIIRPMFNSIARKPPTVVEKWKCWCLNYPNTRSLLLINQIWNMYTLRFYSEQLVWIIILIIIIGFCVAPMIFQSLDNHTSIHGQKMTL